MQGFHALQPAEAWNTAKKVYINGMVFINSILRTSQEMQDLFYSDEPNPTSLLHFLVLLYNLEDFYCQHFSRIGLLWLLAIAKINRTNAGLRIWSIIHQFKRIETKTIAERVLMASQETSTTLHSLLKAGLIAIQASSSLPFCLDIGWAHKSISLLVSGLGKLPCCTVSQTEGMSLGGVLYRWDLRLCKSLQESILLRAL